MVIKLKENVMFNNRCKKYEKWSKCAFLKNSKLTVWKKLTTAPTTRIGTYHTHICKSQLVKLFNALFESGFHTFLSNSTCWLKFIGWTFNLQHIQQRLSEYLMWQCSLKCQVSQVSEYLWTSKSWGQGL